MLGGAGPAAPRERCPAPQPRTRVPGALPEPEPPALVPAPERSSPGRAPPAAGCGRPLRVCRPRLGEKRLSHRPWPTADALWRRRRCPPRCSRAWRSWSWSCPKVRAAGSPGQGPSPETPPRDLWERHPLEPAGYPHAGSPLAFPRHPCLGRSPESPPASADWRVPGLRRTPGGTGWEVGLGALMLPDRGLGFRSVKATVRASRVCLAACRPAGSPGCRRRAPPLEPQTAS